MYHFVHCLLQWPLFVKSIPRSDWFIITILPILWTCISIYLFLFWKWGDIILLMNKTSSSDVTLWETVWQFLINIHVPNHPAIHCLDISSKETKPGVHTDLCTNDYSLVHNSQKLETTQMSISWWMDVKLCTSIQRNTILCISKKEQTTDAQTISVKRKSIMWKNQGTKTQKTKYSTVPFTWILEKTKLWWQKPVQWLPETRKRELAAKGTWKYFPMMKMSCLDFW